VFERVPLIGHLDVLDGHDEFRSFEHPVWPSLGLACQASMQAGRLPSHREQHVDASRDYVVAEGGNAR
jgi:hypothetical protein